MTDHSEGRRPSGLGRGSLILATCAIALTVRTGAAQTGGPDATDAHRAAPPSCDADTLYHLLDFWLGEWRVTADGHFDGTDRVEKLLGGCAVSETWHDANGHEGRSLFYVATPARRWKQVWVTDQALVLGGTKEKTAIARFPDGGVRFQGELVGPLGRVVLDRTTLTPLPDGTVHQVIEVSTDGGSTWRRAYDAIYTRTRS